MLFTHTRKGGAYVVLSRSHRHRLYDDAWAAGRVSYQDVQTGDTFDRDPADFRANFRPIEDPDPSDRPTSEPSTDRERFALRVCLAELLHAAAFLKRRDLEDLAEPVLGGAIAQVRARLESL